MFIVWCVVSDLCDELITRSEGSYPMCVSVRACVRARCGNLNNGAALAPFGLLRHRYEDKRSGLCFSRTELLNTVYVLDVVLKSSTFPIG